MRVSWNLPPCRRESLYQDPFSTTVSVSCIEGFQVMKCTLWRPYWRSLAGLWISDCISWELVHVFNWILTVNPPIHLMWLTVWMILACYLPKLICYIPVLRLHPLKFAFQDYQSLFCVFKFYVNGAFKWSSSIHEVEKCDLIDSCVPVLICASELLVSYISWTWVTTWRSPLCQPFPGDKLENCWDWKLDHGTWLK